MNSVKKVNSQFPDRAGREICEIKPVLLGGNPIDMANKVLLSREDHIRVVVYWNRIIQNLRK